MNISDTFYKNNCSKYVLKQALLYGQQYNQINNQKHSNVKTKQRATHRQDLGAGAYWDTKMNDK